jgi:hypothetical protein
LGNPVKSTKNGSIVLYHLIETRRMLNETALSPMVCGFVSFTSDDAADIVECHINPFEPLVNSVSKI